METQYPAAERFRAALAKVNYKNWAFETGCDGPRCFLQVKFKDCTGAEWKGRKWLLSPHMTDSEVIQTAFKAVMTAEEHETREAFKYLGQAIFGPHYDVNQLAELVKNGSLGTDQRP